MVNVPEPDTAARELAVALRGEFLRLLTVNSVTQDGRRRDFNQAIFATEAEGGWACFNGTDLSMVMDKFDKAVKRVLR